VCFLGSSEETFMEMIGEEEVVFVEVVGGLVQEVVDASSLEVEVVVVISEEEEDLLVVVLVVQFDTTMITVDKTIDVEIIVLIIVVLVTIGDLLTTASYDPDQGLLNIDIVMNVKIAIEDIKIVSENF